jgi:hypothetical protein
MGREPGTRIDNTAEALRRIQKEFEARGISADMDVEFEVTDGAVRPVVKNVRLRTVHESTDGRSAQAAIDSVARADPSNIQAVAASQLEISNDYYQSVLSQAKQSFRSAIVAASVGLAFFLAALGIGLALDKLDVAIISSISGGVVEVIAGLNFWLFGRTATQLDLFHVRLEQTQRYLLANSVSENLSDTTRDTARAELVRLIATTRSEPPSGKIASPP